MDKILLSSYDIIPISSFPLSFQQDLIRWIFKNEDRFLFFLRNIYINVNEWLKGFGGIEEEEMD